MKPVKKQKTLYISGPMTGKLNHNFAAFDLAAITAERDGWTVSSPADIARKAGVSPHTEPDADQLLAIQRDDLSALSQCDAILMLDGWSSSVGARLEYNLATWLGLETLFDSPHGEKELDGLTPSAPTSEFISAPAGVDPKGAAGDLKAPLWLLPPVALESAAWVHKLGATKYGPWNWRKTNVKASTYISAVLRHFVLQWSTGEDLDEESGQSHLAHVICCCNILLDAQAHGVLHDDRDKGNAKQ
jgi:hypothetical protein